MPIVRGETMTVMDFLVEKLWSRIKLGYLIGFYWSQDKRKKRWEVKHNDKEMKE
jgi:hypothetical protein